MRSIYNELESVATRSQWFKVYKLENDIYAIAEPYHFQEVISYLILGDDKALLLDTGMGIDNIKNVVEALTDKEILILNSHTHFDHVGDNHRFKEVMVYDNPTAVNNLKKGYTVEELKPHAKGKLFEKLIDTFDINNYYIKPSNPKAIADGDIINLGDRELKIIHTPGHSDDSIMLWDLKYNVLFTGDSYYPGPLYAHFTGDITGESRLDVYAKSMDMVAKMVEYKGIKTLHPSHNEPVVDSKILKDVATGLQMLARGEQVPGEYFEDPSQASLPDADEDIKGYVIPKDLYCYDFGNFKVIARKVN